MILRRTALLLPVLLAAAAARAATPAPAASVRWLAPGDGAVLVAGERVELAWEPAGPAAALAGAVEWEVFLSVDGGRTWSVRLTPHLDLRRRRFVVEVPDLPSRDVRLVLRAGDEREERAFDLPVRLRIERPAGLRRGSGPAPAFRRGERARAAADGVALWAAGGRDGRSVRWYAYAGEAPAVRRGGWALAFPPLVGAPPAPSPDVHDAPARRAARPAPDAADDSRLPARAPRGALLDPLLAGCRRNT